MLNKNIIISRLKSEYQEYLKGLEKLTKQEIITESSQTAFYESAISFFETHSLSESETNILSEKNILFKLYKIYVNNNYDITNSINFNLVLHRFSKEQQSNLPNFNELLSDKVKDEYALFKSEISELCSVDEILNYGDKIYFFNKLHNYLTSNNSLDEYTCVYLYEFDYVLNTLYDSYLEANLSEPNENFYVVNTNYDIESFINDFCSFSGCNYTELGSKDDNQM